MGSGWVISVGVGDFNFGNLWAGPQMKGDYPPSGTYIGTATAAE